MSAPAGKLIRLDPLRLSLERCGSMVTDAMIFASNAIKLEPDAIRQLCDAASLPPARKVLATADIHVGFGIPIGAVVGMDTAVMPAAVGYDINCGMRLLATPFRKGQIDAGKIAASIAREIPLGEGMANLKLDRRLLEEVIDRGAGAVAILAEKTTHGAWDAYDPARFHDDISRIEDGGCLPAAAMRDVPSLAVEKGRNQLGTLGGGNHFVEIQYAADILEGQLASALGIFKDQIVVMIHSGSRRFGYEIAEHYMNVAAAAGDMKGRGKMLAYLHAESRQGAGYISAMAAAANFAFANRQIMALIVKRCFNRMFGRCDLKLVYDIAHNMAKLERHEGRMLWVHRKGTTRAFGPAKMAGTPFQTTGQPIITPGSMGTSSFLLAGTGNSDESLNSVNHGAGRVMSRTAARGRTRRGKVLAEALISDSQFKRSMEGIVLIAANRQRIREEAPAAYKDIEEVVRIVSQCGWARPVARMLPLAVLKG